jgi:triacylglycerol lipase
LLLSCGGAAIEEPVATRTRTRTPSDAGLDDAATVPANAPIDGGLEPRGEASPPTRGAPYPIVLAHGFFGFDDFAGAGFVHYFHGVKEHLASIGEHEVFTPTVDPFNDSETRGRQLAAAVDAIREATSSEKVVIIAHSQGGLDARFVAATKPETVAAVVTISTPHRGVPLADVALGLVADDRRGRALDDLVKLLGGPLYDKIGDETSLAKALRQFTTPAITEFDFRYPDALSVKYFSIAGRTAMRLGGDDCKATESPPFVADFARERDPTDPLLKTSEILAAGFEGIDNDGLVRVRDARRGWFLGCIPADHLDQVGQLFGDGPGAGNRFRHLPFYEGLVRFLRARGL